MKNELYTDQCLDFFSHLAILVKEENNKQLKKWGIQERTLMEWLSYTTEELGEVAKAIIEYTYRDGTKEEIIKESIQTATLCLKIAEMVSESEPK